MIRRSLCLVFSILLLCFAATACACLPTLSSMSPNEQEDASEIVSSEEPEPEATAEPDTAGMIPRAIFDALCLPLSYLSDADLSGHFFSSGETLSNSFVNYFLYQYVNTERYADRQQYGIAGMPENSESVKLTAEDVAQYIQSVFGPDAFQISYFLADNYYVVRDGAEYYVLIGEVGPSEVTYAGEAPLVFDTETEYSYALTLHYPDITYETDLSVWLIKNEEGAYGYSIANVEIDSLREIETAPPEGETKATIQGVWVAESSDTGPLPEGSQFVLHVHETTVNEYASLYDYENGNLLSQYPLAMQDDGSGVMKLGEVSGGEDYSAVLSLDDANTLECAFPESFVLLGRHGEAPQQGDPGSPFDEDGFVFPDSSDILLNANDVLAKTASYEGYSQLELLGFARNEIFARHGNEFQKELYRSHYGQYGWYTGMSHHKVTEAELNETELGNIQLLLECEEIARGGDPG